MEIARLYRLLGVALLAVPLCAQPVLKSIQPHGGQAGSAVRLVLKGDRLGPLPRLHSTANFAATPLTGPSAASQMLPSELAYLLEVDKDAAPGVYPLRIETSEGISNVLLFTVGVFPQVTEAESEPADEVASNDFRETAQEIKLPVTVEGRLQGPERDVFRFRATQGQAIVAEVSARRAGSAVDPHLELLDSAGLVRARAGDAPGLGVDARLAFTAPQDGDFFVVVRDERFSEQDQNFYRLTIGEFEYADTVFPLGWSRNSPVRVEFSGGNLDRPVQAELDLSHVPANASETRVRIPATPSSIPFLLSDGEEALESDGNRWLSDGIVMNGRISAPGETDTFRLAVESGEEWAFELRSGELASSSLYGVLTISQGDEILAVAGKHAGDPNPYVITSTKQTATYPFVNLAVPPGVNEITVSVEDLLERGGPAFAYRVVARKQGPDFLLALNEPFLNIPRNGSAVLTVIAERRGYYGPIELYVANLPDDLGGSGGHIAPTSTLDNTLARFETGSLTLTAQAGAELRRLNLVVRGRAVAEGKRHLDRRATGPGIRVGVKGDKQRAVTAEWLGFDLPARITPDQPAELSFLTDRRLRVVHGGNGTVAKWAYTARRPEVTVTQKVEIPRNTGSLRLRRIGDDEATEAGQFRMFTHERTSLGMVNFNLSAQVKVGDREETVISQPLEIDVVEGYKLAEPPTALSLASGGEGLWHGSIWRDAEFRRAVTVSATDLPSGVRCESAELHEDQTAYELRCEAADAPLGEYEVEIRAESVLSDEGTTPYVVDPVKAKLTISR